MATFGIGLGAAVQQRNVIEERRLQARQIGLGQQQLQFRQEQAQVAQTNERRETVLQNVADISTVIRDGIGGMLFETGSPEVLQVIEQQFATSLQSADELERGGDIDGANQIRSAINQQSRALALTPTAIGEGEAEALADVAGARIVAEELGVSVETAARGAGILPALSTEQANLNTELARTVGNLFVVNDQTRAIASGLGVDLSQFPNNATLQIESTGNIRELRAADRSPNIAPDGSITEAAGDDIEELAARLFGGIRGPDGRITGINPAEQPTILLIQTEAIRLVEATEGAMSLPEAVNSAQRNILVRGPTGRREETGTRTSPITLQRGVDPIEGNFYRVLHTDDSGIERRRVFQWVDGDWDIEGAR